MPRIAESREPAEPTSPVQRERYRRILRAAAKHGADKGLERMQMHDVAKDAGVAIATLYRYFPSKTHLFTALMTTAVERLPDFVDGRDPAADPADRVGELLVAAGREFLARPLLAHAMLQSNNASVAQSSSTVSEMFGELILKTLGTGEADADLQSRVRIIEAAWYGILISALNQHVTPEEAEADTRLACRRLLGD